MLDIIKNIDIFGKKTYFTLKQQEKYKTHLGAVFTIIMFITVIVFSFLFGSSFFFKTDPAIAYMNVISDYYYKEKLITENFLIPWMIQDLNALYINSSGIVYPQVTYSAFKADKNGVLQQPHFTEINYTFCPKSMESLIPGVSQYYCMDLNSLNLTIGGDWSGPYVEFIQIGLFYCPNYDIASINGNCTPIDLLNNFFNKQVYFAMYYPKVHFDGNNYNNPLKIEYINYYFQLNLGLSKVDRFYFEKIYVQDDRGWIVEDIKSLNIYSTFNIQSDFALFPVSKYYSSFSRIYNGVFYLSKNYDQYNRSYMKFQNLTALIGGFINLIYIFCLFFISFISRFFKNLTLINEVFIFKKEAERNDKLEGLSKINFNFEKSFSINKDLVEKSNFENLSLNHQSKCSNPTIIKINEQKINNELDKFLKIQNDESLEFRPSIRIFLKKLLNCGNDKDMLTLSIYNLAEDYLKLKLDLTTYLNNLEIIERIKFILFSTQQNNSFEYMKKINLYDINQFEDLRRKLKQPKNESLKDVSNYFIEKLINNNMTETDKRIFEGMNNTLKRLILEITH